MNFTEAKEILEQHNRWRKGEEGIPMTDAKRLTEALNAAIDALEICMGKTFHD